MYKLLYILILSLFFISCNSQEINSASCILKIELPNRMFLHLGEYQYPDNFHVKQSGFFGADSLILDKKTTINIDDKNKILSLSYDLLKNSIPLNYGFEKNEDRTDLLYTLSVKINKREKTFCVYDYSESMEVPKEVKALLKKMLQLMSIK